jgi:hypothetical protein
MAITTGRYKPLVDVKAATRRELLPVLKRKIKSKAIMGVGGRMPAPGEAEVPAPEEAGVPAPEEADVPAPEEAGVPAPEEAKEEDVEEVK